jgi:SAM-dependent methyltransferase
VNISRLAGKLEGKVLDFGCGKKPYRSLFTNAAEYTGIDFEGEGHSHVNEEIDVIYDGKSIPFVNDHFDAIFSSEVFEHVFNLGEIIPELKRVLKNNGYILITCPFAICEHEVPNDFARYTSFAMRHMLEKEGFEIIEYIKTGDAIKTIWQLRITYWQKSILSKLKNIPLLRSVARKTIYTLLNIFALLGSSILPTSKELYLNNIVLARLQK